MPGGGGGGGPQVIPFNMSELAPFLPSVFKGPYNAEGALQNEEAIAKKYPWITTPAGQFEGAQPGQFAGANTGSPSMGGTGAQPPNPPIPPTVTQPPPQMNPQAMAQGGTNAMQPNSLQAILSVLNAGAPSAPPGGGQ